MPGRVADTGQPLHHAFDPGGQRLPFFWVKVTGIGNDDFGLRQRREVTPQERRHRRRRLGMRDPAGEATRSDFFKRMRKPQPRSRAAQNRSLSSKPRSASKITGQLTDVMTYDIITPPVASRIYAYAHLALFVKL